MTEFKNLTHRCIKGLPIDGVQTRTLSEIGFPVESQKQPDLSRSTTYYHYFQKLYDSPYSVVHSVEKMYVQHLMELRNKDLAFDTTLSELQRYGLTSEELIAGLISGCVYSLSAEEADTYLEEFVFIIETMLPRQLSDIYYSFDIEPNPAHGVFFDLAVKKLGIPQYTDRTKNNYGQFISYTADGVKQRILNGESFQSIYLSTCATKTIINDAFRRMKRDALLSSGQSVHQRRIEHAIFSLSRQYTYEINNGQFALPIDYIIRESDKEILAVYYCTEEQLDNWGELSTEVQFYMAVTKIKPIRGTVNKAITYIIDPKKTDDELLVSSFGCAASDSAAKEFEWTRNLAAQQGAQIPTVIARHLIQSFDVGEVTPEKAHEIGKQFADEWLKGKYEYVIATHIDKGHCHNHIIFNAVNFVDYHAYRSNKRTYRELRQLSDSICKEHGLSVIPPSQSKGMDYKEYTEAKRGTSWKQKLKQTIDRCVITAKDYDEFLKMMQDAGYEIKTGKYISFRAEGQERFTRAKTIGENYTEERIKERIHGRNPRKRQMQTGRKGVSLIIDIQNNLKAQESKGYEHWAKLNNLKEAARTLNFLTENNLLQYADLEAKVDDIHSSFARTGEELKSVETRLREVQPLIKNISNYQRLKPVYDAFQKAKDKTAFRAKHEAELVIFEAAKSNLLAMQGGGKLPSLKSLQAEQERLTQEQQRLYDERASLKKQAKQIDTIKANVDMFLSLGSETEVTKKKITQLE